MQAFFILVIRHSHTVRCRKPERLARATNHSTTMNQSRTWNEKEIDDLRACYETATWPELMATFGRTKAGIDQRARSLGLHRRCANNNRTWTDQEIQALRDFYPTMGASVVSAFVGRPVTAVLKKAQEIRIKRIKPEKVIKPRARRGKAAPKPSSGTPASRLWTEAEDAYLKTSLGSITRKQIAQELGRTRTSVNVRVFNLGLTTGKGRDHFPIGTDRIYRGRHERKVDKTGVRRLDWKRVDVIEWEAVNGPIPDGMLLVAGKARPPKLMHPNDVPMLAALNSMPPEVRKLVAIKAQIGQALTRIEKLHPDYCVDSRIAKKSRECLPRKPWSIEDDEFLRSNYLNLTLKDLGKELGRGDRGVSRRLTALSLSRPVPANVWSAQDIQRLKDTYANTRTEELMRFFNRTASSIYIRAMKLGLKKGLASESIKR